MYLFELYHQYTKLHASEATEPPPVATWPKEWTTTEIKHYPRFTTFNLPEATPLTMNLSESLLQRQSCRDFSKLLSKAELSSLLFYSIGEKNKTYNEGVGKRMYPSGGARFPLEFYVVLMKPIGDLETGIYHYALDSHGLTRLMTLSRQEIIEAKITTYEYVNHAHVGILCTGLFARSNQKYGERAYRFGLLEAGTTAQNFGLVATALGIGSVIIGGVVDDTWEELLDLDGFDETILYGMFFG